MTSDIRSCATCQHLRGRRYLPEDWKDWQCFKSEAFINLVTGLKEYRLCSEIRFTVDLCGGNWYEEYVPPVRESTEVSIGGVQATEIVFDAATLAANKTAAADRLKVIKEKKQFRLSPTDPDLEKL